MTIAESAGASPAHPERLRERLDDLLGADRWVEAAHPAVAPASSSEVVRLLQGYPGELMVIGGGLSFGGDYRPPPDTLLLLTARLTSEFTHAADDSMVEVSAGWPVMDVRRRLAAAFALVPALERFDAGTIGGRLAAVSSRPTSGRDGWVQSLLGLVVALPDGDLLELGGRCIKDVAGYDLCHLFTGSRGGAGVILRATFRCRPKEAWAAAGEISSTPHTAGRYDPVWRKLLDPKGRMRPGV